MHNPNIKIFETYLEIINLNEFELSKNYLILSGIGNSNSFRNILLKNNFNIVEEIIFPDHYNYKKKELDEIIEKAKNLNAKIITTEKDYVKIEKLNITNIKYIEVQLKIKNEEILVDFLKAKIYE